MSNNNINDIIYSTDHYRLFSMMCSQDDLSKCIEFINSHHINTINIGKELAEYIDGLDDYRYLYLDAYDFTKKLLEKHRSKIEANGHDIVAIYNLGILLEPLLQLNVVQLLKEFSKSTALIIIWENEYDIMGRLYWPTQKNNFYLDFIETQIKILQYAI